MIALLGRLDEPTDALRDYCCRLSDALKRIGITLELRQMQWESRGWGPALWSLWRKSRAWRREWLLIQYTALQWSRRGLPFGLLGLIAVLRVRGARLAMVLHDPGTHEVRSSVGIVARVTDYLRRWCHTLVLRTAYVACERSISTLSLEKLCWLGGRKAKARFIPVGSNVPSSEEMQSACSRGDESGQSERVPRVVVFGLTPGLPGKEEVKEIAKVIRHATQWIPRFELVVFGRFAKEAEEELRGLLIGARISVAVSGLLPAEAVSRILMDADVQLFVKGGISSRRGSAIAAIACGLPIVAYETEETGFPITQAGVLLSPRYDCAALGTALARVLGEERLREELREKNKRIYAEWFSWNRIAMRFAEVLEEPYKPVELRMSGRVLAQPPS